MTDIANEIRIHLKPLVGLRLSGTTRATDMRCFRFGEVRETAEGVSGGYTLNVQCPWRIEGPQGIVTGDSDLCEPAEDSPDIDWDAWDFEESPNLQDTLIEVFLQGYDLQTGSFNDETDKLVVEAVSGDAYGGATLTFFGGCRLAIFPAGTRGENWRVFRPGSGERPFVIAGGRVETEEE